MTATIGVSFGAGSAAKRILLFAINVTVLLLGLACSVLCLYQVKLMPETYEVIVAAIQESNLTTPEPVSLPPVNVSKSGNINNNTIRTTTKKVRPRVSRYIGPKNGTFRSSPDTFVENFQSSTKSDRETSSLGTQILGITNPVTLFQTTAATASPMMTKAPTNSSSFSTRLGTLVPLKNSSNEILDLRKVLKDRIAELEIELRIAQSQPKLPIMELNLPNTQTSCATAGAATRLTSRSDVLLINESIPTTPSQLSTQQTNASVPSITTKSTLDFVSLILSLTPPTTLLSPSTQNIDGFSTFSYQTLVAATTPSTSTGTVVSSTTELPTISTASPITVSTTTITPITFLTNMPETSTASLTTLTTSSTAEAPLVNHTTPKSVTLLVSTTSLLDPITMPPVVQMNVATDNPQTKSRVITLIEISSPLIEATSALTTLTTDMPTALVHTSTLSPTKTSNLSSSTQKATLLSTITLVSTTTSRPVSTSISVPSISQATSTKSFNTGTTTQSAVGFINLGTNVIDSINKVVRRRDLTRVIHKRSSAITDPPVVSSGDTLTADHIPFYFEQVFFLVQTSLYVCTAAGLLIFFSSLVGICGGIFRIDGCLKFSVAALVLVIMAEMATTAFIFVAHDKASNRNKNKNFDRDLKLLCDLANFCVQPMLLVITGSFLCVSVVLQIGSITLACNLMDNKTETDPDKKIRRMMRSSRSDPQFGLGNMYNPYTNPMPMPMPFFGGGGYGNMGGMHYFPYHQSSMMPMQNMYPPVFTGPGQRPIVNIIS